MMRGHPNRGDVESSKDYRLVVARRTDDTLMGNESHGKASHRFRTPSHRTGCRGSAALKAGFFALGAIPDTDEDGGPLLRGLDGRLGASDVFQPYYAFVHVFAG